MTSKLSFAPLTNVKQANSRSWLSRSFALLGLPLFGGFFCHLGQCPYMAQQELRPPWSPPVRGVFLSSGPMPVHGSAGASPSLVSPCSGGFFVIWANARTWLSRSFALLGLPLFGGFLRHLGQCPYMAQQELRPPWSPPVRGVSSSSGPMPVHGSAGASPSLVIRGMTGTSPCSPIYRRHPTSHPQAKPPQTSRLV